MGTALLTYFLKGEWKMGNHDWIVMFQILAMAYGISLAIYLVGKGFLKWAEEKIEIFVGGRIQELCKEFQCTPMLLRMSLADIIQENTILRTHMDNWKSSRLPSVIVAMFLIKWVEEHKGIFKPFIENTKKSVQSFISHLEKVTEEME